MKERVFIQKAKEQISLEEFLRKQFRDAKCGEIEVQHTPVVTRIIIHTTTPGIVIGAGGERISETVQKLKDQFKIDNPQIDVQKIADPDIDPYIVAQNLVAAIENGMNLNKLGNYYMARIMQAGAIGCELVLSGKLSGQRSRRERFTTGYLKKCGEPAERDVLKAFSIALVKLGKIGVSVKIMTHNPDEAIKNVRKRAKAQQDADKKQEEERKEMSEPVPEDKKEEVVEIKNDNP
ncbi:MAG: 30S ribosomal protein S3 [Candidatus Aenigmarchaeota archaeon]|nr:30S ribosomal protein S3 [Candidatus Aenigmarchaeota archaeon]